VRKRTTHIPAMVVPMKTAPRVEATLLDMILRSVRGKRMRGRGGDSADLNSRDPVHILSGVPASLSRNVWEIEQ